MVDRYEALERFSKLRDEGLLSEAEFAAEKAKLLGGDEPPPDHAGMRPAMATPPARRARWPLWLGLGAFALIAIVVGVMLATRPNQITPAATTTRTASTCNSTDARDLLTKAVAASGGTLVAVNGMTETALDAATHVRTCAADLTLAGAGIQHRGFRLLPTSDGSSSRLEFIGNATPVANEPPGNAAAANSVGEDSTAAIEDGTPEEQAQEIAADAKKVITTSDEQGNPICCVNVGDVLHFFSSQGGSAMIELTEGPDFTVDIKDPAGRWQRLTAFELNFSKFGDGDAFVSADSLSINNEPLKGVDVNALLRGSFTLVPSGNRPAGQ